MSCRTWSGIQFRFLDSGFRRNDDSRQAGDMKRKMLTLSPSPADCKKLSIYSQHPSPQGEGTSGNPTASGWGIKNIMNCYLGENSTTRLKDQGPQTENQVKLYGRNRWQLDWGKDFKREWFDSKGKANLFNCDTNIAWSKLASSTWVHLVPNRIY